MATILIVDDIKSERELLKKVLESAGFTVVGEATDGKEAFEKYKELKPDLVTMDILMPGINGIEALSLIRNEDEKAKVVMVTSESDKLLMVDALSKGAEDFILKPFLPDRAIETIREVLGTDISSLF